MTDLTGLTLHRPESFPAASPEVVAFAARRAAARAEREARKIATERRFRELNAAAEESLRTPAKVKPIKAKRAPKPARERKATQSAIRVCAGTCGRMTRPRDIPESAAPGTTPRRVAGKCSTCLTGGPKRAAPAAPTYVIRPCVTCGHSTRSNQVPADKAPGTRPRVRGGECTSCAPRRRRTTPKTPKVTVNIDTLTAEYLAGDSINILSARHNLGKTTTRTRLIDAGVTMRGRGDLKRGTVKTYPDELLNAIRHHYLDRMLSKEETARAIGVSVDTVHTAMKRHGIPARTNAGARTRAAARA